LGAVLIAATSETTPRRHSVGVWRGWSASIVARQCPECTPARMPRATAACRHTSGSRSASSREKAGLTSADERMRGANSSPASARRLACAAARESRRAASSRAGSEPVEGATIHSRASSRRLTNVKASGATSACVLGSERAIRTRGRITASAIERRAPSAMRPAIATNDRALPSRSRESTRRPTSRFSVPGGSAAPISNSATPAASGESHSSSSKSPASSATRTARASGAAGAPSSGEVPFVSAARAMPAMLERKAARRASRSRSSGRPSSPSTSTRVPNR
jgi:hypothetical protein